jgi:predicted XRE-type DNA-binding protein
MNCTSKFESVWDALINNLDQGLKKRFDYLILIQARFYGMSESEEDKARQFGMSVDPVSDLMKGRVNKFSLSQLMAIASEIGVTVRL